MILTDESCNYKFYESLGCELIYTTTVKNKEQKNCDNSIYGECYIFTKKL